eukprot:s4324_g1.t1
MNPVAKIARGMCLDHIRRKGIDPLDDEDSDEAEEALKDTKTKLHRLVDDLSYEDVCRAGAGEAACGGGLHRQGSDILVDIVGGLGLVWACAVCRMPAFAILEVSAPEASDAAASGSFWGLSVGSLIDPRLPRTPAMLAAALAAADMAWTPGTVPTSTAPASPCHTDGLATDKAGDAVADDNTDKAELAPPLMEPAVLLLSSALSHVVARLASASLTGS